jgi:hypothetical protein
MFKLSAFNYSSATTAAFENWNTTAIQPAGRTGITISGGWNSGFTSNVGGWTAVRRTGQGTSQGSGNNTTLFDVTTASNKLGEFISNPNDFISMVKRNLQNVLAAAVVEGLQYEKIGGYVYELRELQKDGMEERDLFIDRLY